MHPNMQQFLHTVLVAGVFLAGSALSASFLTDWQAHAAQYGPAETKEQCCAFLEEYKNSGGPGPVHTAVPEEVRVMYTMNFSIPWEVYLVDDTNNGEGSHYIYSRQDILEMIDKAKSVKADKASHVKRKTLRQSDDFLFDALTRFLRPAATVAVFGSAEPWYEAIALAFGAASVYSVDYNRLTYDHPQITTVTPRAFQVPPEGFDAVFSISSFDHDGLGRYGDPLSPNADFRDMAMLRCVVKPGGVLFLTVPVGPDTIVFNLHRRYGYKRLPRLLRGWEVLQVFGWDEDRATKPASWRQTYEPVFVLRNPVPGEDAANMPTAASATIASQKKLLL